MQKSDNKSEQNLDLIIRLDVLDILKSFKHYQGKSDDEIIERFIRLVKNSYLDEKLALDSVDVNDHILIFNKYAIQNKLFESELIPIDQLYATFLSLANLFLETH